MTALRVLLHALLLLRVAGSCLFTLAVTFLPVLVIWGLAGAFAAGVACVVAGLVFAYRMHNSLTWYLAETRDISRINWREINEFRAARRAERAAEVRR